MALEGNLKDFSLADMFRLLAKGSKTGVLHIVSPSDTGRVCFRGGDVVYASASVQRDNLGKRLSKAGVISEKQLRQALGLQRIQKKEKARRKLGEILIDEGYVERSALEGFLQNEISDALFELFRWEEGELRFESDEDCGDEDIGLAVSIDAVVGDVENRLDQWRRIREKIPSLDTRFVMSPAPAEKAMDIHLKPREWMLLCYLHGGRSVRELTELTGYNDFDTARTLYTMYAAGLVESMGTAEDDTAE